MTAQVSEEEEEEEAEYEYQEESEEENEQKGEKTVNIEVNEAATDDRERSLEHSMLMDFAPAEYEEEEEEEEFVQHRPRPRAQAQQEHDHEHDQQQDQQFQGQSQLQQRSEFDTHVELELADFQCLTCVAANLTQCNAVGTMETCYVGETCHFEMRQKNGATIQVKKGCKQEHSCHDQRKQNFVKDNKRHQQQCRPQMRRGPSVCRKCCKEENCTDNFDVNVRSNWFHDWDA